MKKSLTMLLLALGALSTMAQQKITGIISDQNKSLLPMQPLEKKDLRMVPVLMPTALFQSM
jgi:hypothetical protein